MPYKLQLTLEVLKLHRVISVSGIQYSRTYDYMGDHQHIHVVGGDNLNSLVNIRTCVAAEFCQRKLETLWDRK